MELPLLTIALVVVAISAFAIIRSFGAVRWRSFSSRVDRRTAKQHEFEASWSKILDEAERVAQAYKQKSLQHNARDLPHGGLGVHDPNP